VTKSIIELAREAGFEHYDQFPADYQNKIQRFAALLKAEWLADAGEMPEPVGVVRMVPTGVHDEQRVEFFMHSKIPEVGTELVTLAQCQQAVAAAVARKDAEIAAAKYNEDTWYGRFMETAQKAHDFQREKAALKAEGDELKALVNQQLTTEQVQRAKQALYEASHGDLEAADAEVKAAINEVIKPYVWP